MIRLPKFLIAQLLGCWMCLQLPVQAQMAGNYTINQNQPASGSNFTSFQAAIDSLASQGIAAAVILNVDSNSGPYQEQIIIPFINGVSALNEVLIEGNNNKLTFAPSNSNSRHLIRMDGAQYFKIQNLVLEVASGASYGWLLHLKGSASNNTFLNCSFFNRTNNQATADYINIVTSNSDNQLVEAPGVRSNLIENNTLIGGGVYSIYVDGDGINKIADNQIINNTIRDYYNTGIYIEQSTGSVIRGNNISRPNRSDGSIAFGIVVRSGTDHLIIENNRIHTLVRGNRDIRVTGISLSQASPGNGIINIIRNNLIYNLRSSGNRVQGIFADAQRYFFYNNTIVLNKSGAANTYGFLFDGPSGSTRRNWFRNNIVYIGGSGGNKAFGIWKDHTNPLFSDYNNIFFTSSSSNFYAHEDGIDYMTLSDWQQASSEDDSSLTVDPAFLGQGSDPYQPQSVLLNDHGVYLNEVQEDILGVSRSVTDPDIGAYEFDLPDIGVDSLLGPSANCEGGAPDTVEVRIRNYSQAAAANFQVAYIWDKQPAVIENYVGLLDALDTVVFKFSTPLPTSTAGIRALKVYTISNADITFANDTTTKLVETFLNPLSQLFSDTSICSGSSITLSAGNFESYQWSTTDTVSTIQVSDTGRYSVEVTDINGCSSRDSMHLSFWPSHLITTPGLTSFCPGGQAVLDAGKDAAHYLWSESDTTQSITVSDSGMYWVETTTDQGCIRRDTLSVAIYPEPVVDITITPISPTSRWLDAGVFNSYEWNTNENTRRITVTQNGSYWVEVTDGNGCTGRDTIEILTLNVGDQLLSQRSTIRLYPNPTISTLGIYFNSDLPKGGEVVLWNSLGQQVLTHRWDAMKSELSLDLSSLPKGVYVIGIKADDQLLGKDRLILK